MAVVAVLNTLVQADTSHFERGMDKSGAAAAKLRAQTAQASGGISNAFSTLGNMSGFGGVIGNISARVGGFIGQIGTVVGGLGAIAGGALAAAAAGLGFGVALAFMASHGADAIASINKLSKQVGISVEALSSLSTLAGADPEAFGHSVIHMQRAIEEGSAGAGRALAQMGLEMGNLREQTPLAQLEAVYGAFNRLNSQGERAAAIRGLFGRGGNDMLESLSRGAAGLEAARQRARDFGLEFTQAQADAVRAANREWSGFGMAMRGIGIQAASMFAPLWESIGRVGSTVGRWLVGAFQEAAPWISIFGSTIWAIGSAWVQVGAGILASIASIFSGWQIGWEDVKTFGLTTFAVFKVTAERFRDVFLAALDLIKLKWLEILRTFGVSGLEAQITALQKGQQQFAVGLTQAIDAQVVEWRNAIGNVGRAVAGNEPAPGNQGTAGKAITGTDAALAGSERAYSILNSQRGTAEQVAQSQLEINRRMAEIQRDTLAEIRRAPRIRAMGR